MAKMESAGRGVPGAVAVVKAGELFTSENSQKPDEMQLDPIRVELRDRKPVASCSIATVEGGAAPICSLARKLLTLGVDPAARLTIWSGGTKCFHDVPVGRWAELTVDKL